MSDRIPFGRLLRDFRVEAGLTQDELAERARMSAGGVSVLERGIRTAPRKDTIALLSAALGLSESDRSRLEASAARRPRPRRRASAIDGEKVVDRHNLPLALNSFLGREQECALVLQQLSQRRLVTICGVGGVGKSRLALETARSICDAYRDGVWLTELAALDGSSSIHTSIAALLGVSQQMAPASGDAWIGAVVGKDVLLILDNCEHVLPAVAAVAKALLERCPQVRILATSREPLRITGEIVVRLRPLAHPHADPGSAIRLFLDRASDVAPEYAHIDREDSRFHTIRNLCRRLDGLPLAIELAAAHAAALSPEMLMGALERQNELPIAGVPSAPRRHQTLRGLLDWSYGLLEETARTVLRQLAVFAGGCTLDALEALCDGVVERTQVLPTLLSLVEKSLVVADTRLDDARYDVLVTTRAYVREQLVIRGELARALRSHAEYYCGLAKNADAAYGTSTATPWLSSIEPEFAYLAVWALVGCAVYAVYRPHGSVAAGVVIIIAGIYEASPLKHHLRERCRESAGSGLCFGISCVGSCIGLMAIQIAVGFMSIGWMSAIAIIVLFQKTARAKAAFDVPLALAIVGLGVLSLVTPSWIPGLLVTM